MKQYLTPIGYYLRRVFRVAFDFRHPEKVLWNDLKKYHLEAGYKSGIFEKDRSVETVFSISKDQVETFYYQIYDGCYHCRVKVLSDFPPELTTELFVLASHFNNLLNNGTVVVHVSSRYVEYHLKRELLVPLLYNAELHTQLILHYRTAKDVYGAFHRLVEEGESPAIIIADLLKSKEENDKKAE